jgi:hypothetical protein
MENTKELLVQVGYLLVIQDRKLMPEGVFSLLHSLPRLARSGRTFSRPLFNLLFLRIFSKFAIDRNVDNSKALKTTLSPPLTISLTH